MHFCSLAPPLPPPRPPRIGKRGRYCHTSLMHDLHVNYVTWFVTWFEWNLTYWGDGRDGECPSRGSPIIIRFESRQQKNLEIDRNRGPGTKISKYQEYEIWPQMTSNDLWPQMTFRWPWIDLMWPFVVFLILLNSFEFPNPTVPI